MVQQYSFHIIGAGKVAQTLAVKWQQSHQFHLAHIHSRSVASAQALQLRIGAGHVCHDITRLPPAHIVAIGVNDDAIGTVDKTLSSLPWISAATIIIHFSGAKSSQHLIDTRQRGAQVGSLHPIFAFASVDGALAHLAGHHCAIEGSAQAVQTLQHMAHAAHLKPFIIDTASKALYHAGLSMSANFLITLNAMARSALEQAGISAEQAQQLVAQLMQQNLSQLHTLSPQEALTGPIVRGDASTVAAHLAALPTSAQNTYTALAWQTVELAAWRLSEEERSALAAILPPFPPQNIS